MSYKRPHKYSNRELRALYIKDLEQDIRCARRDGLDAYADKVAEELERLKKARNNFWILKNDGRPVPNIPQQG